MANRANLRMRRVVIVGAAVALLFIAGFRAPVSGQHGLPDPGNSVQALALDSKGTLYVGTFGKGIYRTQDSGKHWEAISDGLEDPFIMTLYLESDQTIYAGTARMGMFRSRDGGKNWEKKSSGLASTQVPTIVHDAKNRVMYIGTGNGVFKSTDQGDQWAPHNTGLNNVLVRSLVAVADGALVAGTGGQGLYRLKAAAGEWEQLARWLRAEVGILENYIRTLTVNKSSGAIYAGTFDGGVFVSLDHGDTWSPFSRGLENQSIRSVIVGSDQRIYTATGNGIYVRGPKDDKWTLITAALEDTNIQSMVINPAGEIFAGTAAGLYKGSATGGWASIHTGLFKPKEGI